MNITQEEQNERVGMLCTVLESGEFQQVDRRLREGDKMCCLGVACEVYRRVTGKGEWVRNTEDGVWLFQEGNSNVQGVLHDNVAKWYGFTSSNPALEPIKLSWMENAAIHASEYNDLVDKTFPEIAAAFRKRYIKKQA